MTTPTTLPAVNADEMNAVNLADEHVEHATANVGECRPGFETALVHTLLAIDARLDALRHTHNRELPDIGAAIMETVSAVDRLDVSS